MKIHKLYYSLPYHISENHVVKSNGVLFTLFAKLFIDLLISIKSSLDNKACLLQIFHFLNPLNFLKFSNASYSFFNSSLYFFLNVPYDEMTTI